MTTRDDGNQRSQYSIHWIFEREESLISDMYHMRTRRPGGNIDEATLTMSAFINDRYIHYGLHDLCLVFDYCLEAVELPQ